MRNLNEAEKLTKLKGLIAKHDLTYQYSDDHQAWERGSAEIKEIMLLADTITDRDQVVALWNANIDQKIAEEFRSDWYWKKPGADVNKTEALNSAFKIKEDIVSNYDSARSNNDVPAEEYYKYLIEDIEKIIECIKEAV